MIFRPSTQNFGKFGHDGKNCSKIRNQQEKVYQNVELFFLGFEKVQKMQVSVIRRNEQTLLFRNEETCFITEKLFDEERWKIVGWLEAYSFALRLRVKSVMPEDVTWLKADLWRTKMMALIQYTCRETRLMHINLRLLDFFSTNCYKDLFNVGNICYGMNWNIYRQKLNLKFK